MVVTEQSGETEASTLRQEQAALQEQNRLLRAEVIALRQQAHYHRTQHQRAVQRAQELGPRSTCSKPRWPNFSSDSLVVRASEPAERPLRTQPGKAASVVELGVSNQAVPVMAVSSGRIFRWWRLCWISASNKSAVRSAAWRGKVLLTPTPANRSNGKCACFGVGPFDPSIVVPPAAIASRSVRTSSRHLWHRP